MTHVLSLCDSLTCLEAAQPCFVTPLPFPHPTTGSSHCFQLPRRSCGRTPHANPAEVSHGSSYEDKGLCEAPRLNMAHKSLKIVWVCVGISPRPVGAVTVSDSGFRALIFPAESCCCATV